MTTFDWGPPLGEVDFHNVPAVDDFPRPTQLAMTAATTAAGLAATAAAPAAAALLAGIQALPKVAKRIAERAAQAFATRQLHDYFHGPRASRRGFGGHGDPRKPRGGKASKRGGFRKKNRRKKKMWDRKLKKYVWR